PRRRRPRAQRGRSRPQGGGRGLRLKGGGSRERPAANHQPEHLRSWGYLLALQVHACRRRHGAHRHPKRPVQRARTGQRVDHPVVYLHRPGGRPCRPVRTRGQGARHRLPHLHARAAPCGPSRPRRRGRRVGEGDRRCKEGQDSRGHDRRRPRRGDDLRADAGDGRPPGSADDRQYHPPVSDTGGGHQETGRRLQPHPAHSNGQVAVREMVVVDPLMPFGMGEDSPDGTGITMPKRKLLTWLKLAALVGFLAAAVYYFRFTEQGRSISPEYVLDSIESHSPVTARLIYVAVYIVGTVLLLPGTVLSFAGAVLFGAYEGTLYTWMGAVAGSTLSFLLARWLGRDFVERLFGGRFAAFDQRIRDHGFTGLLIIRLLPVFPFNAVNFGCGLTGLRLRDYVLATAIGIVPGTFVYQFLFAKFGRRI